MVTFTVEKKLDGILTKFPPGVLGSHCRWGHSILRRSLGCYLRTWQVFLLYLEHTELLITSLQVCPLWGTVLKSSLQKQPLFILSKYLSCSEKVASRDSKEPSGRECRNKVHGGFYFQTMSVLSLTGDRRGDIMRGSSDTRKKRESRAWYASNAQPAVGVRVIRTSVIPEDAQEEGHSTGEGSRLRQKSKIMKKCEKKKKLKRNWMTGYYRPDHASGELKLPELTSILSKTHI